MNDEHSIEYHTGKEPWYVDERVLIRSGYTKFTYELRVVRKVGLKTGQVLLDNGKRFLADGREITSGMRNDRRLVKHTPELERMALRQERINFLTTLRWDNLSDYELEEFMKLAQRLDILGEAGVTL